MYQAPGVLGGITPANVRLVGVLRSTFQNSVSTNAGRPKRQRFAACHLASATQVPVLFTGSMRDNLDPFHEHSDASVWAALRRAHLAPVVEASPSGLGMILSEGGSPLSAGQKQLAALARALLKHSKARRLVPLGYRRQSRRNPLITKLLMRCGRQTDNTLGRR